MRRVARTGLPLALAALGGLVVLGGLGGCNRAPAERADKPLETIDVTEKPDAEATLETDKVAAPRADALGVAGALPADFPQDVPLPKPSSLVDFTPHGVTLEVQAGRAEAKAAYLALLKARGFAPAGADVWQKGARRIGVAFADAAGATRITVEIR